MYNKKCAFCGKEFETKYNMKNICSFNCRMAANRDNARISTRIKRKRAPNDNPCEICGWNETIDRHHESDGIHYLCPNHHSLITRNGIKIEDIRVI